MGNQNVRGKHDVLISYSSKDKNVADAVVVDLEQHGIRCWYAPRDILPGEHWVSAIKNGIEEAQAIVLIFTEDSNSSPQVMNEIAMAFNAGKTIIPFRMNDGEMNPELEYYLSRVHWLDAVSSSMSQDIERLRNNVLTIIKPDASAAVDSDQPVKAAETESIVAPVQAEPVVTRSVDTPAVSADAPTQNPSGLSFEEYVALSENDAINEKLKKSYIINYVIGAIGFVVYAFVIGLVFMAVLVFAGLIVSLINQKKNNYVLSIVALVLEIPMLLTLIGTIPIMMGVKTLNEGYKAYSERG